MPRRPLSAAPVLLMLVLLLLVSPPTPAPAATSAASLTTLHTFGVNPEGASPTALIQAGGFFYAVTVHGGAHGRGTVCASRDGTSFSALHSFSGPDGGEPIGGLIQGRDGALYGTTLNGGLSNYGTVYKINADGSGFVQLHSFSGSDGMGPRAALLQTAAGLLYGTAASGGAGGSGEVFSLAADGSGFAVAHSFSGADGNDPTASLIQARGGLLYGTTLSGGATGSGTVFRLAADGSGFATLHTFGDANGDSTGAAPDAALTETDSGALCGTTLRGGANGAGAVYRMAPDGTGFAALYSFGGASTTPAGPLLLAGGALYGTTSGGSSATVFRVNTDGTGFTVLHSLGSPAEYRSGGSLLKAGDGTLYGVMSAGGANLGGAVFQMNLDGSGFVTRYDFSSTDGTGVNSAALQGADGLLYGTTPAGGAFNVGTLYRVNTDGTGYTVLHTFSNKDQGGFVPNASLAQGPDGLLYGTTRVGPSGGMIGSSPTVFKIAPDGTGFAILSSLYFFGDPVGPLVPDGQGSLYGVTNDGSGDGAGCVFKLGTDGSGLTVLHSFGGPYGSGPGAGLLLAKDGLLYGTTGGSGGGAALDGTVFKIGRDGSGFTVLHTFGGPDGNAPMAALIQARGGALYGSTRYGGAGGGTLFQVSPDGMGFATLHRFSADDGGYPAAALLQATDGSLYGTLSSLNGNGPSGCGAVFKIGTDGTGYTPVYTFQYRSPDGYDPAAPLIQGRDGSLYGTTGGYPSTLFRLNLPSHTHLLWNNTDGRVMLWSVAPGGSFTLHGFGPYYDDVPAHTWSATAVATGPDGKSHLLWNNTDGRVMLWTVGDDGAFTLAGYGPYTDDAPDHKWSAMGVSVGPDNVTHLLWSNTDRRAMLWSVAPDFSFSLAGYGPYTDDAPGNLWSVTAVATGPDNVTRLVWNNTDNRVMLWDVAPDFSFTLAGYGPYTDGAPQNKWSAAGVSVGPDNVTHLLWGNTDRRAMFWNVDGAFNFTLAGYGPYTDDAPGNLWSAAGVATGPDGLSHLLWGNTDRRAMLWGVDPSFGFTVAGYGPYTDDAPQNLWSVTAVSAGP